MHITSVGTSLVGAYPGRRRVSSIRSAGSCGRAGDWYGQRHGAARWPPRPGYQWTAAPWRPWLRAGWFRSSGDRDAGDDRHGTFFQMLPTARRYSLSTIYNLMNLTELFGQVLLRPRAERRPARWTCIGCA